MTGYIRNLVYLFLIRKSLIILKFLPILDDFILPKFYAGAYVWTFNIWELVLFSSLKKKTKKNPTHVWKNVKRYPALPFGLVKYPPTQLQTRKHTHNILLTVQTTRTLSHND